MKRFWRIFGNVLIASALMSRAAAALGLVEPKTFDDDIWMKVRKDVEQSQSNETIDPEFGDALLAALSSGADLRETILISYHTLPEASWTQLDGFWQNQKIIQTSAAGIQAFVDVRSSLTGSHAVAPGKLYDNWILQAHHKPGHYDQGGGNG